MARRPGARAGWGAGLAVAVAVAWAGTGCSLVGSGSDRERVVVLDPPGAFDDEVELDVGAESAGPSCADARAETGVPCDDVVGAACYDGERWWACRLYGDGSGADAIEVGNATPLASPDGNHLVLWLDDGTSSLLSADGQAKAEGLPRFTQWLADDRLIARSADGFDLFDLQGEQTDSIADPPSMTDDPDLQRRGRATLSPDGTAIVAYVWEVGGPPGTLAVYRFDTATWTPLDFGPGWIQISNYGNWTPDGATVYLVTQTTSGENLRPGDPLASELVAIDVASGERRVVDRFSHTGFLGGTLSPDGRLMAIRSETSTVVVDVASGEVSPRVATGYPSSFPALSWSPGSDRIALELDSSVAVLTVGPDLTLSNPRPLATTGYHDVRSPTWIRAGTSSS